jgi:hypothetical protein
MPYYNRKEEAPFCFEGRFLILTSITFQSSGLLTAAGPRRILGWITRAKDVK